MLKDEILEIREIIGDSLRTHVLQTINTEYTLLEHDERIYQDLLLQVMLEQSKFSESRDTSLSFVRLFTHSIKNFDINVIDH